MLRSVSELFGYTLAAEDGTIGKCSDFLFGQETWVVRYMVADTARWLPGKTVVLSPVFLGPPEWAEKLLPVGLTRQQIKDSPPLEEHLPVSRQKEAEYFDYYQFPYYWEGAGLWGVHATPQALATQPPPAAEEGEPTGGAESSYLRSTKEVLGYRVLAGDEEIGTVDEWILDDESWVLRYLVVDTGDWLPGRKVLVATRWVDAVDWGLRQVAVGLSPERVRNSPEYDPSMPVNREYEQRLYDYYGRPADWK